MSSTNRGSKRVNNDFYRTPSWCVKRLLEDVDLPKGLWFEPCAGNGAIIEAVNSLYSKWRPPIKWRANEINKKYEADLLKLVQHHHMRIGDYLTMNLLDMYPEDDRENPDVIISNPPFSIAMQVVEHSFAFDPTYVVMLLRLNFLASAARAAFMRRRMPDVYVLPNRPSFTGGATDSIEYAWFVWGPEATNNCGEIRVLATTNLEDRKK